MSEKDLKYATGTALALFVFTILMGAAVAAQNPDSGDELIQMINNEIFSKIMDEEPAVITLNLFLNNLEASLLLFIGGATFGILTCLILSLNGLVIGMVLEIVLREQGVVYVAASIVPHGIFEIPAFILAAALGLRLAASLWNEKNGTEDAAYSAKKYARMFALYVIPLLAAAALIEGFITPDIIKLVI